ncbi:hypothetical protein F2Q70_00023504 [Brassica cretica]|nr:hypothetical protein F2Q70_00023504 [Brassica cretica]
MDLVTWIRTVAKECRWKAFDVKILSESGGFENEMVTMMKIGIVCVALELEERPHIAEVVKMVEGIRSTDAAELEQTALKRDRVMVVWMEAL